MQCPICHTINESSAAHCSTCAWYFPLQGMPNYGVEFGRAKREYMIIQALEQLYYKEQASDASEASDTYEYPKLEPIQQAEDFDTPDKRIAWWESLEVQWQEAFNQGFLLKEKNTDTPTDEELIDILESPTMRLVGTGAMRPDIDFKLTNLSGIKHLTNLNSLFVSYNTLTDLTGIEHLKQLTTLFVDNSQLTDIKAVHYLPQLQQLYCQENQLTTISAVASLTNLTLLYCNHNQLNDLQGITLAHAKRLKNLIALPNEAITPNEIQRIEALGIFCRKG